MTSVSRQTVANVSIHGGFVRNDYYEPDDKIPHYQWFDMHTDYDSDESMHNFVEEQVETRFQFRRQCERS